MFDEHEEIYLESRKTEIHARRESLFFSYSLKIKRLLPQLVSVSEYHDWSFSARFLELGWNY